jgi:hypothetical protein
MADRLIFAQMAIGYQILGWLNFAVQSALVESWLSMFVMRVTSPEFRTNEDPVEMQEFFWYLIL